MKRTSSLRKVGNSLALVFPKPLCDDENLSAGQKFEIETKDNGLFSLKVISEDAKKYTLEELLNDERRA